MSDVTLTLQDFVMRVESLVIYKNVVEDPVIKSLYVMANSILDNNDPSVTFKHNNQFMINLVEESEKLGLTGNIFAKYVVSVFLNDVNQFSLACEKNVDISKATINTMAEFEINVMCFIATIKIKAISDFVGCEWDIANYTPIKPAVYEEIDQFIEETSLRKNFENIKLYYKNVGCGILARGKIFKFNKVLGLIKIENKSSFLLKDIFGYEKQKEYIINNFELFLKNRHYENLLLAGCSGTGKTSMMEAILNKYYEHGLRMVNISKWDGQYLDQIIEMVEGRGKKVILFIDDISNEVINNELKELKFIIETRSDFVGSNIIFCANYNVKNNEELMEVNKSSLSKMFGKTIIFESITKEDFFSVVQNLAMLENLHVDSKFLLEQAEKWIDGIENITGKEALKFVNSVKYQLNN
jgi:uncharacterized protein